MGGDLCAALRLEAPTEVRPISGAVCGARPPPSAGRLVGPARISRLCFRYADEGWGAFLVEKTIPSSGTVGGVRGAVYSAPMSTLIDFSRLIAAYAIWLLIIWWAY